MQTKESYFRFYEELNDFLPPKRRKQTFPYGFFGTPAVKDAVEAVGIPHTEVDLILIDGTSVGFSHRLQGGERVAVYPVFESLDISPIHHLRPTPLRTSRFVLDVHLGALCRSLRMLGFDSFYRNDLTDPEIVSFSITQHRIILTRDRGILKHRSVTHGYYVRSTDPKQQIEEVVTRLDLCGQFAPYTRCIKCNGLLYCRPPEKVKDHVPPRVAKTVETFMQCEQCGALYWRGSHTQAMERTIQRLRAVCGRE